MNDAKDEDKDDKEDDSIKRSLAQGLKNNSRGCWMEAEVVLFIFPVGLLWKGNFVNQL